MYISTVAAGFFLDGRGCKIFQIIGQSTPVADCVDRSGTTLS